MVGAYGMSGFDPTELTLSEASWSDRRSPERTALICQYCQTGAPAFYVKIIGPDHPYRRTLCSDCIADLTGGRAAEFLPCRLCRLTGDSHQNQDHPFEPTGWPDVR